MPYVTSFEQIAEERANSRLLVRQLTRVCGPLPEAVQDRIRNLHADEMETLAEELLDFESLADLENWLQRHEAPAGTPA